MFHCWDSASPAENSLLQTPAPLRGFGTDLHFNATGPIPGLQTPKPLAFLGKYLVFLHLQPKPSVLLTSGSS